MQTLNEISKTHGISVDNLRYRKNILGFKSDIRKEKTKARLYTNQQCLEMVNFNQSEIIIPKIIHHTITYNIYQSKMNYENL